MTVASPSSAAWRLAAIAAAVCAAGCAIETVEFQNREAAHELARQKRAPGSVYLGWRVFQDRCAGCHGVAATGSNQAPDLLPIVRTMSARQFTAVVLKRYEWGLAGAGAQDSDVLVDGVLQRREPPQQMPEWHGEPRVSAHLIDLFAYLSARAEGTQGPQRPVE